jgi:hypothetical protein
MVTVESYLTETLNTQLCPDSTEFTKQILSNMVTPDGPLGAFASKIKRAYLMGYLTPDAYENLQPLGRTRVDADGLAASSSSTAMRCARESDGAADVRSPARESHSGASVRNTREVPATADAGSDADMRRDAGLRMAEVVVEAAEFTVVLAKLHVVEMAEAVLHDIGIAENFGPVVVSERSVIIIAIVVRFDVIRLDLRGHRCPYEVSATRPSNLTAIVDAAPAAAAVRRISPRTGRNDGDHRECGSRAAAQIEIGFRDDDRPSRDPGPT